MKYWIEEGVLVLEMTGPLPSAEATLNELSAILDGVCGGPYPVLFDVKKVQGTPSRADQERVLTLLSSRPSVLSPQRAIVVNSLVQYGLARLGMVLHEARGLRLTVFRDRQEALRHLKPVDRGSDTNSA